MKGGGRRGGSPGWSGRQCAVPPGELAAGAVRAGGSGGAGGGVGASRCRRGLGAR